MGLFDGIIDMGTSIVTGPGGASGIIGSVLKVVFPQVEEITSTFLNFDAQLNDLVTTPIQGFIGEIEDGEIWEGAGAEAFEEECRSIFLPQNQQLQGGFSAFGGMLQKAKGIMQEADKKALTQVNTFEEAISKIKIG